ncbi:hypothetical protein HN873_072721 [Arachis hypogaea]|uniref:HRDC domain-containing protein n=1 Tax=Arachis hypogaea TaxID=3818 RepID=A0A444X9X4_ARAHY|nr:hypothetical protein Ahy_B10g106133 [Arachis hypogaea]
MNVDRDQSHLTTKVQTLQTLTAGPLSSSIAKLSASSRCIPSDKDFHFYRNFDEFKVPIADIARESRSILEAIGASGSIWGREAATATAGAFPADMDEAYDWMVSVNDDILERFDVLADECRRVRQQQEEAGRPASAAAMEGSDDGFQLVCGKKKRGSSRLGSLGNVTMDSETSLAASAVKVATKDKKTAGPKPKVPFHIPTIRRPQEEFNILVNNSNMPFEHVWLERSDDGLKFIHPLEKLNVLDFVDKDLGNLVPVKPSSLDSTPFKLVDDVKGLKELAAKLRSVDEFAVDLEHNQYRSFQGLTCLMQISTRSEDFVIDTLKLRIHVGPYLREIFKDPSKRKVMHGADRDIVWLQRDFGIYICNLFDTGQASKVLKLERNSLEYLLHHFCEVTANKEYQNADWRLRPLPNEMQRYAREDTHYLLYMYDLMRIKLFSMPKESESSDTPLVEVYKCSYDVCMQLYEKELLTENSYLHIYGLQGADFNAQQLAIVSGLCEWRDLVARAEDESTGYVLPNKSLLEIAKQMPLTTSKLRRLVKSKHPYIEHNLDTVVSIIRNSLQNAAAFEEAAQQLKQLAASASEVVNVKGGSEDAQQHTQNSKVGNAIRIENTSCVNIQGNSLTFLDLKQETIQQQGTNVLVKVKPASHPSEPPRDSLTIAEQHKDGNGSTFAITKGNGATVQVLKKPTGAFGALLGNLASKRKLDPDKGKEDTKLEQIKSSVNLPFHSFSGRNEKPNPVVEPPTVASETSDLQKPILEPVSTSSLEEIIMLESGVGEENTEQNDQENSNEHREKNSSVSTSGEEDDNNEPSSLSELSSSFQKCFQSNNKQSKTKQPKKLDQPGGLLKLKPFDYEEARKHIKFGEKTNHSSPENDDSHREQDDSGSKKKRSTGQGQGQTSDLAKQLPQGRRRQAFPASGNRSATFRYDS